MDQKGTKWLCKSIPRTDRSEPIQHNCLEIDNLLLSCSIAAALLTLGFRHKLSALGALHYPHVRLLTRALMVLKYLYLLP